MNNHEKIASLTFTLLLDVKFHRKFGYQLEL